MKQGARAVLQIMTRPFIELWRHRGLELVPFIAIVLVLFLLRSSLLEGLHIYINSVQHKLNLTVEMQQRLEMFACVIVNVLALSIIIPSVAVPLALGDRFEFGAYLLVLPKAIGASLQTVLLSALKLPLYLVAVLTGAGLALVCAMLDGVFLEMAIALILSGAAYSLLKYLVAPFLTAFSAASIHTKLDPDHASRIEKLRVLALLGGVLLLVILGMRAAENLPLWGARAALLTLGWYSIALIGSIFVDPRA